MDGQVGERVVGWTRGLTHDFITRRLAEQWGNVLMGHTGLINYAQFNVVIPFPANIGLSHIQPFSEAVSSVWVTLSHAHSGRAAGVQARQASVLNKHILGLCFFWSLGLTPPWGPPSPD